MYAVRAADRDGVLVLYGQLPEPRRDGRQVCGHDVDGSHEQRVLGGVDDVRRGETVVDETRGLAHPFTQRPSESDDVVPGLLPDRGDACGEGVVERVAREGRADRLS